MSLVSHLSGLGVDPVTAAAIAEGVRIAKTMTGPFQFPAIQEMLEKVRLRYGPDVVDEIYRRMPVLQKTRPVVVGYPGVALPVTVPDAVMLPEPAFLTAADLGGATVPLLIAAGLALVFILKR